MSDEYTSTGTVRMQLKVMNSTPDMKVLFVPDSHHSLRHDDQTYAVFVSRNRNVSNPHAEECKKGECCIQVASPSFRLWFDLRHAAINQCKVEIDVEVSGNKLTLTGITIPAKRDK